MMQHNTSNSSFGVVFVAIGLLFCTGCTVVPHANACQTSATDSELRDTITVAFAQIGADGWTAFEKTFKDGVIATLGDGSSVANTDVVIVYHGEETKKDSDGMNTYKTGEYLASIFIRLYVDSENEDTYPGTTLYSKLVQRRAELQDRLGEPITFISESPAPCLGAVPAASENDSNGSSSEVEIDWVVLGSVIGASAVIMGISLGLILCYGRRSSSSVIVQPNTVNDVSYEAQLTMQMDNIYANGLTPVPAGSSMGSPEYAVAGAGAGAGAGVLSSSVLVNPSYASPGSPSSVNSDSAYASAAAAAAVDADVSVMNTRM